MPLILYFSYLTRLIKILLFLTAKSIGITISIIPTKDCKGDNTDNPTMGMLTSLSLMLVNTQIGKSLGDWPCYILYYRFYTFGAPFKERALWYKIAIFGFHACSLQLLSN